MAPFSVVEDLDVFEQADVGGLVVEPAFVAGQLGLERMEAGLGHGVVPAVSLAAHALHETVVGNPLGESGTGVLDAATDTPVGQVAHPHLMGALRSEIAPRTIRRHRKSMPRVGRHRETTTHDRAPSPLTQASGNAIFAHFPASVIQGSGALRAAGTSLTGGQQALDFSLQASSFLSSRTKRTPLPGVETTARHRRDTTPHSNRVNRLLHVDEGIPQRDSLATKAAAFFKLSRSRVTRFNARRGWRISSSRSGKRPVPGKAPSPWFFNGLFQRLMIPPLNPNRCSTPLADTPSSEARRTASDLNSRSYLRDMLTPPARNPTWRFEVSTQLGKYQLVS